MARQPRYVIPDVPQLITHRGNNRAPVFLVEDDYAFYRGCLEEAAETQQCAVHAYVLMPNHTHLLVTPRMARGVSKMMQSVSGRYAQYLNAKYRRSGTVWEGRYRATVIDPDEYLLFCMSYIELNPVRAGLVAHPRQYPWSSYRRNAEGRVDVLVRPHRAYERLGDRAGGAVQALTEKYRALMRVPLNARVLVEIRRATNKGWLLGGEEFRAQLQSVLNRRATPLPRGGDRRSKRARANVAPIGAARLQSVLPTTTADDLLASIAKSTNIKV